MANSGVLALEKGDFLEFTALCRYPEFEVHFAESIQRAQSLLEKLPVKVLIINWDSLRGDSEAWLAWLDQHRVWLRLPVLICSRQWEGDEPLFFLNKGVKELIRFPMDEREWVMRLSFALEHQFLIEGTNKHLNKQKVFNQFFRKLNTLRTTSIHQEVIRFAVEKLNVRWVSVWLTDTKEETLRLGWHSMPDFKYDQVQYHPNNLMWKTLIEGKSRIVFDFHEEKQSQVNRKGMAMLFPMISDGVLLGVVNFTNFSHEFFDQFDLDDLEACCHEITSRLGYAINFRRVLEKDNELAQSYKKLEQLNEDLKESLSIQQTISNNLLDTSYQLKKSGERLEQLNHLKDEFLAVASHDLRSPLCGIRVAVETVLLSEYLDPSDVDMLEPVIALCDQQLNLVTNLLDVAKIEAGRLQLDKRMVNHEGQLKMFAQIELNHKLMAKAKGIHFNIVTPDNLPTVEIDDLKLQQVLNNLISNAIKFTPDRGAITVTVGVNEDGCYQVTVADTGMGIPPEALDRIFDRFEQVKERNLGTRGEKGTGLGLAICKNIVEMHEGHIWIESQVGKGSQFHFELPLPQQKEIAADDVLDVNLLNHDPDQTTPPLS